MTAFRRNTVLVNVFIAIASASAMIVMLTTSDLTPAVRYTSAACCGLCIALAGLQIWPTRRTDGEHSPDGLDEDKSQLEELRVEVLREFKERADRLSDRESRLTQRMAQFQEIFEYPLDDPNAEKSGAELQELTGNDRRVQEVLAEEAERVYRKIRSNGYLVNGELDLRMIREEIEALITRVARIYSPDSGNPLLETSFEQLARAASRIWLHALVLLEQLPLDVQKMNIADLYGYLQKATSAWDTYKAAAPWLKRASRGLYAGRMISATNPVALGAWWLAMEVGRRGASRLVESWVDRQAVAVLNDLVAVIGLEVASIYGTGFRQRDAAWIHGCEIVELLHRFPPSREGLQAGLNLITQLPLKNEYDRIYLYRCVATHQSTRHRIADSSILDREDREEIASSVEEFFRRYAHGVTEQQLIDWRTGLEERLDLKLQLDHGHRPKTSESEQLQDCLDSLYAFMVQIVGESPESAAESVMDTRLGRKCLRPGNDNLAAQLIARPLPEQLNPPNLDPASEMVTEFLNDLADLVSRWAVGEDHVVEMVQQTGAWFRRPAAEVAQIQNEAWVNRLRNVSDPDSLHSSLKGEVARQILIDLRPEERIVYTYPGIGRHLNDEFVEIPDGWLVGFVSSATSDKRAAVYDWSGVLWRNEGPLSVERKKSILLDSAELPGGRWCDNTTPVDTRVVVSGSLRGGRYSSYFRALLES